MSLRRPIGRLMICIAFVLATTYVQAMAHVDDIQSVSAAQHVKSKLPPCHQTTQDGSHDQEGHHDGCCSNFACATGLIADNAPRILPRAIAVHEIDYGSATRCWMQQPLHPPPKSH